MLSSSSSSDCSLKLTRSKTRSTKAKSTKAPPRILHFTLNHDEWKLFYDNKSAMVADNWSTQLSQYIARVGITCSIAFKKRHEKKKESRKKNCNLFSCYGQCRIGSCPVNVSIVVEEEPKNKTSPSIFTVYVFGDANHNRKEASSGRPLSGLERSVMGMFFVF